MLRRDKKSRREERNLKETKELRFLKKKKKKQKSVAEVRSEYDEKEKRMEMDGAGVVLMEECRSPIVIRHPRGQQNAPAPAL